MTLNPTTPKTQKMSTIKQDHSKLEPRLLLPAFPPELRNNIYAATVSPTHPATNAGLPFTSKSYEISATTVEIHPVYRGSAALLALAAYRFQEGREYESFLFTHGIELRVVVKFKALPQVFIAEHWARKLQVHMRKLVKKYAWVGKAVKWDVRVIWQPKGGAWEHARYEHKIPGIVNRMADELVAFSTVKGRVDVHIALCLGPGYVAFRNSWMNNFLAGKVGGAREERREVIVEVLEKKEVRRTGLVKVPDVLKEKEVVLVKKGGIVEWGEAVEGRVLGCSQT
ncbi:hypothetical protein CC78DRAFT_234088 [Lojkania enalia]|uniref:Uncharacterized protein n=1 Tax=Lojkania enalia TaxID=147567 RepID=A0A9P4N8D5_9PLEO|nr:hypothetical protein CC78DRAFT_234088 [Didymosphaeria enalia]